MIIYVAPVLIHVSCTVSMELLAEQCHDWSQRGMDKCARETALSETILPPFSVGSHSERNKCALKEQILSIFSMLFFRRTWQTEKTNRHLRNIYVKKKWKKFTKCGLSV